jgi:hypothetical protein
LGDRAGLKAPTTMDVQVTATPWEQVAAEVFVAHLSQSGAVVGE